VTSAIRALIVDDEAPARAVLRHMLTSLHQWRLVADCANSAAARTVLSSEPVDVVLLDIRMPGQSGLILARELAQAAQPPLIIFVTAFDAHAIEAFELYALDYVLKPFTRDRLHAALQRAAHLLALRQQTVHAAAVRSFSAGAASYWEQVCVRSVGSGKTPARP
jgi:DNA-binding LytR/AlgR family response regulator